MTPPLSRLASLALALAAGCIQVGDPLPTIPYGPGRTTVLTIEGGGASRFHVLAESKTVVLGADERITEVTRFDCPPEWLGLAEGPLEATGTEQALSPRARWTLNGDSHVQVPEPDPITLPVTARLQFGAPLSVEQTFAWRPDSACDATFQVGDDARTPILCEATRDAAPTCEGRFVLADSTVLAYSSTTTEGRDVIDLVDEVAVPAETPIARGSLHVRCDAGPGEGKLAFVSETSPPSLFECIVDLDPDQKPRVRGCDSTALTGQSRPDRARVGFTRDTYYIGLPDETVVAVADGVVSEDPAEGVWPFAGGLLLESDLAVEVFHGARRVAVCPQAKDMRRIPGGWVYVEAAGGLGVTRDPAVCSAETIPLGLNTLTDLRLLVVPGRVYVGVVDGDQFTSRVVVSMSTSSSENTCRASSG